MQSFKDNCGASWLIEINVATLKRVKALTGVDLAGLLDDGMKPLEALLADIVLFVDVLFAICRDRAANANISDVRFGEAMAGDVLGDARDAFLEALTDFFPNAEKRKILRAAFAKTKSLEEKILQSARDKIESLSLDNLAERLTASYGEPLASLASTPDPSPSAN